MMERARIQVVDDDHGLLTLMKVRLEAAGYQVALAGDGAEALTQMTNETPELAIVDLKMEPMDGLTLLDEFLRAHPDLPVIMLTAYGTIASAVEATRRGAYDYLTKPFDAQDLLHRIQKALEVRRLRGQVEQLRKQADDTLREEARVAGALARVGRELIESLNTPTILNRLCQLMAEVLECDWSVTFLLQADEDTYVPVASHGNTPEERVAVQDLKVPGPLIDEVLARLSRGTVVHINRAAPQTLRPLVLAQPANATQFLCVALRRGEEIVGIQTAGYRKQPEAFSPQQERIAQGIGQLASLALSNARLLEEVERANRLKSDFLATMSHELRTPLSVIMGYTEMVLENAQAHLTPEQIRMLQRADDNARDLLGLITALLDVSRLEAARLLVETEQVDLPALLNNITTEARELLRSKPMLTFVCDLPSDLPPLHTDRAKLKIVLKNLVGNAVKFTDTGSVQLHVTEQSGGIAFHVSDTGIGIVSAALPVMFEMFRQGDSSSTRRHEGVGLGLYIVKRMLELLGGKIEVESSLGHGSTFHVWLPLTPPHSVFH